MYAPQGRIKLAIALICVFENCRILGVRLDFDGNANQFVTRFVRRLPVSYADPCEDGGAECGSFLRRHHFDGMSKDIRLNLTPKARTGTPAANPNALHRNIQLMKDRQRILQAEGHTFKDRADYMSSGM
jgi:hypothetical protein